MIKCSDVKKGYLLALIAGSFWGSMGVFVKFLGKQGLDSMTISAYRPTIAVIFYIAINLIKNRENFKIDFKGLLICAFYGIASLSLMCIASSYAVQYTGVATASVLLFINPVLTVVVSYFMFGESFTKNKFWALILAIVGCCLVVKAYDTSCLKLNLVGILWGLASGVTVTIQAVIGKLTMDKYPRNTILMYSFLFATVFLWFFVPPWKLIHSINGTFTLFNIFGVGIIATIIPTSTIILSLKYIESGKSSIIASIEPVIASILAFIIFGELFEFPQFIGMILIMSSILLVQLKDKNKTQNKDGNKKDIDTSCKELPNSKEITT